MTLELMDRFTIRAVDDIHELGLDRDAAAMLMIESDLPGAAADDELTRAEAACTAAGATTTVRSQTRPRPTCCARPGERRTGRSSGSAT